MFAVVVQTTTTMHEPTWKSHRNSHSWDWWWRNKRTKNEQEEDFQWFWRWQSTAEVCQDNKEKCGCNL